MNGGLPAKHFPSSSPMGQRSRVPGRKEHTVTGNGQSYLTWESVIVRALIHRSGHCHATPCHATYLHRPSLAQPETARYGNQYQLRRREQACTAHQRESSLYLAQCRRSMYSTSYSVSQHTSNALIRGRDNPWPPPSTPTHHSIGCANACRRFTSTPFMQDPPSPLQTEMAPSTRVRDPPNEMAG